jgi:branched-chain amino acid transport system substrate-binding protein
MKKIFTTLLLVSGLAAAYAEEVKVGVVLPLTGHLASWVGIPPSRGVQVALEEIAETKFLGPGRTIRAIVEDDAGDKTQVITLLNKVATRDKVSAVVGPATSILSGAGAPIANQLKTPHMAVAVSEAITRTGPYSFKILPNSNNVITTMGQYLVQKAKIKSLVMITSRDSDATVTYGKVMREYLQANGIQNVTEETALSTDTDFTVLATKIASMRPTPDAIFVNFPIPEPVANFVIQAKQAGLPSTVKIIGLDSLTAPSYAKVGGAAVNGTLYPTYYFPENTLPLNQQFVARYRKKYNAEPDIYVASGYTSMMLVAMAIKNAGPNASNEQVRDALAKLGTVRGILGDGSVTIDANRNPNYAMRMMVLNNGKAELVN